jgi:hypothetical protein
MPQPPPGFELPRLQEKPRDKRLDNLRPGQGRVPGVVNKVTRDLKSGILDGAIAHGADGEGAGGLSGYLHMCATRYPRSYMQLLGKLLPLTLSNNGLTGATTTVNIVGIPTDHYLSKEGLERAGVAMPLLEHVDQTSTPSPEPITLEEKLLAMSREQLLELAEALHVGK